MTGNMLNGGGRGARSGAQILLLLATPLNVRVLAALGDGARGQTELRREVGAPAHTTLRAQLRRLLELGAIERRRRDRFPGVIEYELLPPGRELGFVAEVLAGWLDTAPDEPLQLGTDGARLAIKALADAWSSRMLRAFAAAPLSLTELDGLIASLSYPSLERRLAALRMANLVEARPSPGRGTPYVVTDWLRQAVGPLLAAVRWERRHAPSSTPQLARLDFEALLLLALPLVSADPSVDGRCRLATEISMNERPHLAGVTADLEGGRVAACTTRLHDQPDTWALGSLAAWISALIDCNARQLELGGKRELAQTLVESLHGSLFGVRTPNGPGAMR